MPSLTTKREKKRWRGSVSINGKRHQKLFPDDSKKSYKAALLWENETKRRLKEELQGKTPTVSYNVIDWANQYLTFSKQKHAKVTYDEKRSAFANFLKTVKPDLPLTELTPAVALMFLQKQAKERSGYASNKERKNLGAGWNWGKKFLSGFPQDVNPFYAVDKFPEKRSPRYVPLEEDFWAVYNIVEGQDKVMLLAFLHLAARRKEIFQLIWDDVDFINKRVRLWTRKREGGDFESDWLPMTSELREAMMNWWENRPIRDKPNVFLCLEDTPFCHEYYGKPFTVRQHFMHRMCERAGVKHFGFHAIRHLTATILYQKGYSVSLIQSLLRHKNPNTTTRYLKSLGLEQVRDALEEGLTGPAKIILFNKKKVVNG